MKSAASVLVALGILATAVTWWMSRPIFDERLKGEVTSALEIADPERALTFARTTGGEVLLVTRSSGAQLDAVSLTSPAGEPLADAIDAYHTFGVDELVRLARDGHRRAVDWSSLGMPIDDHYPHIAAGTNFREHAEEVGHEGEPFLFPKLSRATAWNADVVDAPRLDYEVEICAVPLTDHTSARPAKLGYLLCGDFTDRWSLVLEIDTQGPMGPTGFPTGKGGATRLPVGALFVVPRDAAFFESIEISLYVNDRLRQRASGGQMIWSPDEILSRALAGCETGYYAGDVEHRVSDCEAIPARTLILTGTPGGVMFKVPTIWNPLAYLRPGDIVVATATHLGHQRNEIVWD